MDPRLSRGIDRVLRNYEGVTWRAEGTHIFLFPNPNPTNVGVLFAAIDALRFVLQVLIDQHPELEDDWVLHWGSRRFQRIWVDDCRLPTRAAAAYRQYNPNCSLRDALALFHGLPKIVAFDLGTSEAMDLQRCLEGAGCRVRCEEGHPEDAFSPIPWHMSGPNAVYAAPVPTVVPAWTFTSIPVEEEP